MQLKTLFEPGRDADSVLLVPVLGASASPKGAQPKAKCKRARMEPKVLLRARVLNLDEPTLLVTPARPRA